MFRSYRYIGFNHKTNKYEHEIIDSDFVVIITNRLWHESVIVANEYVRRNLPVAKNMALLCLYLERDDNMENIISYQDRSCKHIYNWAEIAAERDRILEKLWAMKNESA